VTQRPRAEGKKRPDPSDPTSPPNTETKITDEDDEDDKDERHDEDRDRETTEAIINAARFFFLVIPGLDPGIHYQPRD
jgi:hypothetical protein